MTDPQLAERQTAIVRRRATDATWAVVWAIGSAELLFASFAIGSSLGPVPLRPVEVLVGSTAFFVCGAIGAVWLARRRQEKGAVFKTRVREGRKEHRVVVFDDHLTIDGEVVLKDAITALDLDERGLVLKYKDPRYSGPVLRELTGEQSVLEEIRVALRARADS